MQALPLQNFSPDLFPGLVLVLAPALGLVYSISAPNKSEAPTLPGLTQIGEDSASDSSGVAPVQCLLWFRCIGGCVEAARRLASREPPMLPCNACYGFAASEAVRRLRGG